MQFNSFTFGGFLLIVLALNVALRDRRAQNAMLLVASYVFYGWWNWKLLTLIAASTALDYVLARQMVATDATLPPTGETAEVNARRRRMLVRTSVGANLALLGFFKYFNFFCDSAVTMARGLGLDVDPIVFDILLPVGISFYTFQTLSYTIDVYRRQLEPAESLLDFALFVSFFPQLVAGPIERASTFLPQVQRPRILRAGELVAGVHLITWGLFKKVALADNAAVYADAAFNDMSHASGLGLVLGALAFTLQIYCDFSAYSDIARGCAKLLGFELMLNFRLPYFAQSPSDFWRRWHISLSTWLRDYLYITLGGNRGSALMTYRNLTLTMLLGGLWHGARWNYVLWGAFHGLILVIYRIVPFLRDDVRKSDGLAGALNLAWRIPVMFALTVIGWVLFRAETFDQIRYWFTHASLERGPGDVRTAAALAVMWLPLAAVQTVQQLRGDLLWTTRLRPALQVAVLALLCATALIFGQREASEFIYFQF
ncbi:MAG: MBOAT family protein [Myxococcales bacterium]|nr:MBOAT family protein [Myxococcales bacterium]MCB9521008.1 MBOAT family protein [Myxococcales bacterium]MCB9531665.1 MBOAT family protein [Myxococcales bacterium]